MEPLREWIEQEQEKAPREIAQDTFVYCMNYGDGLHDGWLKAMKHVLKELKAREDVACRRIRCPSTSRKPKEAKP